MSYPIINEELSHQLNHFLASKGLPTVFSHLISVAHSSTAIDEVFPFIVFCNSSTSQNISVADCNIEYKVPQKDFGYLPIPKQLLLDAPLAVSLIRFPCELDYIETLVSRAYCHMHEYLGRSGICLKEIHVSVCRLSSTQIIINPTCTDDNCTIIKE